MRSKFKGDADANLYRLLMLETVQKDLGLTVDQIEKIKGFAKIGLEQYHDFVAKHNEILPPSQSFPSEEFEARQRKLQQMMDELQSKGKELSTKVGAMLTPAQLERLKQIQIQATVPGVLARPQMIKALGISKEQGEKIRALCDGVDEKFLAEHPALRGHGPKERRQDLIKIMKEQDKAWEQARKPILDVLTPEQRAKLDKLQGKKIEITWPYDELVLEDIGF